MNTDKEREELGNTLWSYGELGIQVNFLVKKNFILFVKFYRFGFHFIRMIKNFNLLNFYQETILLSLI